MQNITQNNIKEMGNGIHRMPLVRTLYQHPTKLDEALDYGICN